jgi:hypothetical protein
MHPQTPPETHDLRRDAAQQEALATNAMLVTLAGSIAFLVACLSVLLD